MFLYICTLRNYEKLFLAPKTLKLTGAGVLLIGPFSSLPVSYYGAPSNMLEFSLLFKQLQIGGLLFIILYLLLSLFRVVKVSESFKGTLMKYG